MHDVLPQHTPCWQWLERVFSDVASGYGYEEIRLPIVEKTELFVRTIGEVTDIVEKEMYTFADRNGDSLTLRPEGTAGCVRACIENGLLHNQSQRLWYAGPMFRHERPQKGRYRQFYQIGAEAYGMAGPDIDVELILMSARLWRALGVRGLRLEINTLGTAAVRAAYRAELVAYLEARRDQLDEDSQRRLERNPLRILDSKNPAMQTVIAGAPRIADWLDETSQAHFAALTQLLADAGVACVVNPQLVRGLDYYEMTVFEWVSDELGAQGTVCAGGRYDGLIAQLGGRPTPAAGFALGMDRLIALLEQEACAMQSSLPHLYVVAVGAEAQRQSLLLSESIRDGLQNVRVKVNCEGGSFKSQFKRADKSGAFLALIVAEEETARGEVGVKFLRDDRPQLTVARDRLVAYLRDLEILKLNEH
jgi:histidyl-tRNA synthetase